MPAADEKPLVVITGVTGYLGSQTCLSFLRDGSYRVRGTVRSTSNQSKLQPLRDGFGDLFSQLELAEADLNNEASLVSVCAGATYVVHTASPFSFSGDCTGPAVAGTNAIMKACTEHGVKRLVMTSSSVAIQCVANEDKPKQGEEYDESYWSNPDRPQGLMDYFKSKTLAEKAAWDFQKTTNPSLEIATINPVFIMGPSLCSGDGTSEGWLVQVLNGSKTEIPVGGMGFVDVRDCALAHLLAVQRPEAANKRFILNFGRTLYRDVYGWLAPFNDRGAKVPTTMAVGDEPTEFDLLSNRQSREVLGITYTPIQQTFVDMAESLLVAGKVK